MGVVEIIKEHSKYILGGIPAALTVAGALWIGGAQLGSIRSDLDELKSDKAMTAATIESLRTQLADLRSRTSDMQLQIQRLQDRLEMKGQIFYQRPTKRGIQFDGE